MKVEVLCVENCPSRLAAAKLVREALAAQGVEADIAEVIVRDERMAEDLRFSGSPTIRVNGRDVPAGRDEPHGFALRCRLQPGSRLESLPPAAAIRRALAAAREGEAE